tara:strand:+ start:328 stop:1509 length:1182 start_codon:yes stop_codon:yes gene_type:complete
MLISPFFILISIALLLVSIGLIEFNLHQRVLTSIPLRIHVNGTRGKSSVTRLIAAGLREGGVRTFAKTTGTAPRVIDSNGKDRIIHRLRLPSIGEQVRLLNYFSNEKSEAVVIECMAVQPQYQWISEHQMVRSNIGVITNARPDHLEEMGPTDRDVALSLCNSIPVNGVLVTAEDEKADLLQKISENNGTKFIRPDDKSVTKQDLEKFSYIEHPSNISVALEVCEQAGVKRNIAIKGMQKVQPDLGALISWMLFNENRQIQFINGMAANDPVSTLQIWKFILDRYPAIGGTCVFFNARDDRPVRTKQMIELTLKNIKPDHFIVRADKVGNIIKMAKYSSPNTRIDIFSLKTEVGQVVKKILALPNDSLLYAIGNQVGDGQEILNLLSEARQDV